jgi:hypothetical protein
MLPPDQHVAIYGDQKVGDVGAHLNALAQIGHKNDLEILHKHVGVDRRAKVAVSRVQTRVDWIESENQAIHTIEFRVKAHELVKILLQLLLLVLLDCLNYKEIQNEP